MVDVHDLDLRIFASKVVVYKNTHRPEKGGRRANFKMANSLNSHPNHFKSSQAIKE